MCVTTIRRFTDVMFKNSSNNSYSDYFLIKIIIFRQARDITITIKLFSLV